MPDETEPSSTLSVAGVVQVTPLPSGRSAIRLGPSVGWFEPKGISRWENELSVVAQADLTTALARALRATLPVEQIAPRRFPMAAKAVEVAPLLPIATNLVANARAQGARVHTVGIDRVTAGFYYFAEGGSNDPVHVQGNLVDMLGPSLSASDTNAQISALLEDLIGRLLLDLSGGIVSELHVELANALPRLSRDGTGLAGTDLESFDSQARALAEGSTRWAASVPTIVQALSAAERAGRKSARIPLFGEAERDTSPSLDVTVGGKVRQLPGYARWLVTGAPRDEMATRKKTPFGPFVTSDGASAVARGRRTDGASTPDDGQQAIGKARPAGLEPERASNGEAARGLSDTKTTLSNVEPAGTPEPMAQPVRGAAPIIVDAPPPPPEARASSADAPSPALASSTDALAPARASSVEARGALAEALAPPPVSSAEPPGAPSETSVPFSEAPTPALPYSPEAHSPRADAPGFAARASASPAAENLAPRAEASSARLSPRAEASPTRDSATATPVPPSSKRLPSALAPLARRLSSLASAVRPGLSLRSAPMAAPSGSGPDRTIGVIVLMVLLLVAYLLGRLLRHHFMHTP
jgi:hypothetical protein